MAVDLATPVLSTYEPIKFELSQEIVTHEGTTRTLTLKMVKAGTYIKYGSPLIIETDPKTNFRREVFNYAAVMGFLSDATGVDPILLANIPGCDVMTAGFKVLEMLSFSPKPQKVDKKEPEASTGL